MVSYRKASLPLPRVKAHGQKVPKFPCKQGHIMGPATLPLANEPMSPNPVTLEPMKVEDTKETLELLEMPAERIEIVEAV